MGVFSGGGITNQIAVRGADGDLLALFGKVDINLQRDSEKPLYSESG